MVITAMFVNYDAERDRTDLADLGLSLPFLLNHDCGLGIAVKSYIDELCQAPTDMSKQDKKNVYGLETRSWFPFSEAFSEDVDMAFDFVDQVRTQNIFPRKKV